MLVIGVTGPSGSGKGTVSSFLSDHGIKIIDADEVYHSVIAPPSPCLEELVEYFGQSILEPDGTLSRKRLSELVFGDGNGDRLKTLNVITHKYVVAKILSVVKELEAAGERVSVIDAPLLIESGLSSACDIVIAVISDKELRISRIMTRDKISDERARMRVSSQPNDSYYTDAADIVIRNDGSVDMLSEALSLALAERGVEL